MATIQASNSHASAALPPPVIPMRQTPWFLWALWALAGFLIVGLVYSFWRMAAVPTPILEVPITAPAATNHPD